MLLFYCCVLTTLALSACVDSSSSTDIESSLFDLPNKIGV